MTDLLESEIYEALNLSDFVAIDIETTGLDYLKEDIIEFAAVHFHGGEVVNKFHSLVKPDKAVPKFITRLTGISDEDVRHSPSFADLLPQIRKFISSYPIIAHNINFDISFLEYHARKAAGDFAGWSTKEKTFHYFPNPRFDTILLARLYCPFLSSFSLASLVNYFQISTAAAHRALPDAEAAGKVFLELLGISLKTKFSDVQKILQILEPTEEPLITYFEKLAVFLATGHQVVADVLDREKFSITADHYNIIGEGDTPLFGKTDLQSLDEEQIAAFFEDGGSLSREFSAFEVRQPQVNMAREISKAFNQKAFLTVEAGTGTGKSMAYLVPAIKWAVQNYGELGRVVITTNTKNLQEQLFFKDIPMLHALLGEKFKAVLLKGKANYLCLDKWVTVMNDMNYRLTSQERIRLLPLYFWAQKTDTGDISENNGFNLSRNIGLWTKLIAENNYCPGKSCKYYDRCFLMKARNNARNAHLVLVNHSLLFSDLAAENAVLSDYYNVIFDEAHNIEKTATEYLGVEITLWQFRDLLNKLYLKERIETGLLVQLKRRVQGGRLKQEHLDALLRMTGLLVKQVPSVLKVVHQFFRELTRLLSEKSYPNNQQYNTRFRYRREDQLFEPLSALYIELEKLLKQLKRGLFEVIEFLKEVPDESFEYQRQLYQDLNAQWMQVELLLNNLGFLLTAEWENYVYWFELPNRSDSDDSRLYAAPLDIGEILYEKLYRKLNSAVFTSATLAVNQNFEYFHQRVGLQFVEEERLAKLCLDSPFNYREQVFLGIPTFLPDPADPRFSAQFTALLEKLATNFPKGTLVLFTSYSLLNHVYQSLRQSFEAENISLLAQGIDGSRHSIINRFKETGNAVLFGTDSFWEGVDIPGSALEMLLITKLPFDVPSDPIIQARSELLQKQGRNAFLEYSVPEAVIRFRQGFGRLIRNHSDYGAVLVLDTRVIKKFYGRIFLESLPVEPVLSADEEELRQQLRRWFR